jgi:hypothetical protein
MVGGGFDVLFGCCAALASPCFGWAARRARKKRVTKSTIDIRISVIKAGNIPYSSFKDLGPTNGRPNALVP